MGDQSAIIQHLKEIIGDETKTPAEDIDEDVTFHALGLDSISAVFIIESTESEYGVELSPLSFWDYPTIRQLAGHISQLQES